MKAGAPYRLTVAVAGARDPPNRSLYHRPFPKLSRRSSAIDMA